MFFCVNVKALIAWCRSKWGKGCSSALGPDPWTQVKAGLQAQCWQTTNHLYSYNEVSFLTPEVCSSGETLHARNCWEFLAARPRLGNDEILAQKGILCPKIRASASSRKTREGRTVSRPNSLYVSAAPAQNITCAGLEMELKRGDRRNKMQMSYFCR